MKINDNFYTFINGFDNNYAQYYGITLKIHYEASRDLKEELKNDKIIELLAIRIDLTNKALKK